MKKYIYLFVIALIGVMTVSSCNKLDKGTRYENKNGDNIRIKTLSFGDPIYKTYTYDYNEDGSLKSVDLKEDGWAETYTFDYSVPGQISIGDGKVLKLNEQGLCKEYIKNKDESLKYEYNTDGYMTRATETWQGSDEIKSNIVVDNGNVVKWSKWSKQGEETQKNEHFKKFTYGAVANIRGIYQADNDYSPGMWIMYTGLFGKPSKNLCTSYTWDYAEGNPDKLMTCNIKFSADGVSVKTEKRFYGSELDGCYTYGWEAK